MYKKDIKIYTVNQKCETVCLFLPTYLLVHMITVRC